MIYFLDNCSVGSAFILLTVTKEKLLELDQHEMNLNTQPVLRIRIRGICIFSLDPDVDLYKKWLDPESVSKFTLDPDLDP